MPARALLVNLDFDDVVYGHMFARAVLKACGRRSLAVDLLTPDPLVGNDIASQFGADWWPDALHEGSTHYFPRNDAAAVASTLHRLCKQHDYQLVITNCRTTVFAMLLELRALRDAKWLVYDRHLHQGADELLEDPLLRTQMSQRRIHLFGLPGTEPAPGWPVHRRTVHAWPLDDAFFAPRELAEHARELVVFSGGDSGRDYRTLLDATEGLPVRVRVATSWRPRTRLPAHVVLMDRLPLHRFRDEVRRSHVTVVPLSGRPRESGVPVVAMAMMMARPVVATDLPSVRGHIPKSGEAGYLVALGDVNALRRQLARLIEAPAERKRVAQHARKLAARACSLKAFAERMLDAG